MNSLPPSRKRNAWALTILLVATIPLVAYAAGATGDAPPETSDADANAAPQDGHERPAPRPIPLITLRFEHEGRLELPPGETRRVAYVVENVGDEAARVRVEARADARGIRIDHADAHAHSLPPGERARGHLALGASHDAPLVTMIRLEARATSDRGDAPSFVAMAFLPVYAPPQPAPPRLPIIEPPTLRIPPPLEARPAPMPACEPCWRPPTPAACEPSPLLRADGEVMLQLMLRGRIENGKLVIDLEGLHTLLEARG